MRQQPSMTWILRWLLLTRSSLRLLFHVFTLPYYLLTISFFLIMISPEKLGAGCSVAAGLPTWGGSEAIEWIGDRCEVNHRGTGLIGEIDIPRPSKTDWKTIGWLSRIDKGHRGEIGREILFAPHSFIQALPGKGRISSHYTFDLLIGCNRGCNYELWYVVWDSISGCR